MAKVVVPRGPVVSGIGRSAERQSRVIALELYPQAGVGGDDYCVTPPLGNNLWLYTIDVWVYCTTPGGGIGGFFYLMYGSGIPPSGGFIATRWNRIIPLSCGVKPGFFWIDCVSFHRHFEMAKLFTSDELRFGVVTENAGTQRWLATVAFEISEG